MKNSTKGSIREPLTRYNVGHVRYFPVCLPPTLDDYNFFVQAPFWVFLDSMERSWSLESDHILFNGNWCSHPC